MKKYYTILVPWAPKIYATKWHPTDIVGPFSTLNRGAFATYEEAIVWAKRELNGTPYTVQKINPEEI
jgi:hypothetical protein